MEIKNQIPKDEEKNIKSDEPQKESQIEKIIAKDIDSINAIRKNFRNNDDSNTYYQSKNNKSNIIEENTKTKRSKSV